MALQIPGKLKTAALLLFLALALTAAGGFFAAPAQAESEPPPVNVIIDGEIIEFDVEPQIIAGRTLVPMRGIFEHLGAEVSWHEETRRVTARRELDEQAVSLTIGSLWAVVNGEVVELDTPPMLYGNRTLIPMRFVAESFGADVWWKDEERQVIITTEPLETGEEEWLSGSEIYQKYKNAVVQVLTLDAHGREISAGTGFNISPEGTIATSYHVLEGAAEVEVFFDDGYYPVQGYLAVDEERDLVVLDIAGEDLPVVNLGDASTIRGGEHVVVIGYPLQPEKVFSEGSANRITKNDINYIITTAPVAPGSSGSPLFNTAGRVVGVLVASLSDGQNYNLAVPINYLSQLNLTGEPLPLEDILEAEPEPQEADDELFVLPFDVFADYLQKHHSQIILGTHNQIYFSHVLAEEGADTGNVLVIFLLDKGNYNKWLTALNEGYEWRIQRWADEVFEAVEAIYPAREMTAGVMLQDCFVTYPTYIPPASIETREGCYYVEHYIGYFYHLNGERHYRWY